MTKQQAFSRLGVVDKKCSSDVGGVLGLDVEGEEKE